MVQESCRWCRVVPRERGEGEGSYCPIMANGIDIEMKIKATNVAKYFTFSIFAVLW